MEERKKVDRLSIIKNLILVAFVVILVKILYMTTFKYEHYTELAENKTYKQLLIKAPRGEIKDRYGRLLAGNKNLFTVQVSGDEIKRKDSNGKSMANDICLKLINLLEKNNEEYIDEFPIYIQNGKYYYTFDKNIREYKNNNNIPQELDAKESFYYLVDQLVSEGVLTQDDRKLEVSKLQKKLNENGYYPPILVSKWLFTEQKNKQDWLESYGIENSKITAKKAFYEIRNNKNYKIDKNLSDSDARKILVVRDLIKSQGYSQYNPITIATDISQKTISQLEEKGITPLAYKLFCFTAHYRTKLNFTFEGVNSAQKALERLYDSYLKHKNGNDYVDEVEIEKYRQTFLSYINDDLNMPAAMSVVWEVARNSKKSNKYANLLLEFDKVLGLDLVNAEEHISKMEEEEIPEEIKQLIEERKEARDNKDWEKSDKIRDIIIQKGYSIKDTKEGIIVKRNS